MCRTRRFTVWHRAAPAEAWARVSEHADMGDAGQVVFDGFERAGGAWKAIPTRESPDAADEDDEDE